MRLRGRALAPDAPASRWEPYQRPPKDRIRITETSCCGAYEWACQGGQFLILRAKRPDGHEEIGRGLYMQARAVWAVLIAEHAREHLKQGMALRRRRQRARDEPAALSGSFACWEISTSVA